MSCCASCVRSSRQISNSNSSLGSPATQPQGSAWRVGNIGCLLDSLDDFMMVGISFSAQIEEIEGMYPIAEDKAYAKEIAACCNTPSVWHICRSRLGITNQSVKGCDLFVNWIIGSLPCLASWHSWASSSTNHHLWRGQMITRLIVVYPKINVCICVYVCMYIYIYTCVCVYTYTYANILTHISILISKWRRRLIWRVY